MGLILRSTLTLLAPILLTACAKQPPRELVILQLDDGAHIGRAVVSHRDSSILLDQLNLADVPDGRQGAGRSVERVRDQQVIDDFAGAIAGQPRRPTTFVVLFDRGANVSAGSVGTLDLAVAAAQTSLVPDVGLVGHADLAGDAEQNRQLSRQRAAAIQQVMVAHGIAPDVVHLAAVGTDYPLVLPNAADQPGNRAVEITVR